MMSKAKSAMEISIEEDQRKKKEFIRAAEEILDSNNLELVSADTFDWGVRKKGGDIVYFFMRKSNSPTYPLYEPTRDPIFTLPGSFKVRTPSELVGSAGFISPSDAEHWAARSKHPNALDQVRAAFLSILQEIALKFTTAN